MPSENLFTHTELMLKCVHDYWVSHLNLKSEHQLIKKRIFLIENVHTSLEIFSHTERGRLLLTSLSSQCPIQTNQNIHRYFAKLMKRLFADRKAIEALSKTYQSDGMAEFLAGSILLITGPSVFVYVLPLLTNPVVFALVFLATCIIVPLIANLMLNCAVNNLYASRVLKNTFVKSESNSEQKALYNPNFFKDNAMDDIKSNLIFTMEKP